MAVEITDANYEELAGQGKLMLMDFWAQWCVPCRSLSPVIEELANVYADRAIIGKVDVDDNTELVDKFGIRNVPTVLFVKDGEVVDKAVGACPKRELIEKIEAVL